VSSPFTRRARFTVPIAVFLAIAAGSAAARGDTRPDSIRIGRYSVLRIEDEENGGERVEVRARGETLFKTGLEHRVAIGAPPGIPTPLVPLGSDVNGNGVPDVVVYGWSGGAHCCFTLWVLELGKSVTEIAKVDGGNHAPGLANLDGDAAIEVMAIDDVFADWPDSFGGSPFPRVVLDWGASGLSPSCELTFEPLAPESLQASIARLRENPGWKEGSIEAYSALMSEVVGLFYRGHDREAIELFHAVRPAEDELGLRLLLELGGLMERSAYWRALRECPKR
jgi:hypothetical protein